MLYNIKFTIIFSSLFLLIFFNEGCGHKGGNPVLNYLQNSELKFSNKTQRDNIMEAARDILLISVDDLKKRRYKDYDGNEGQWDLQTLLTKHFVPKKQGLAWGDDFYNDVKQDSVQSIFSSILAKY